MYRSVLALLFASVLLLSGCAVGQQTVPKEKSGRETNMDGAAFDRPDEEITYTCCTCLKNRTQTVSSSHARNYQHITAYRTATGQSDML